MSATIPDEFLDLMDEKFRMLADPTRPDPTRLAILRSLTAGERNVTQVVEETGRNQANVSKHLKMLAEAGLVARRCVEEEKAVGTSGRVERNHRLIERLLRPLGRAVVRQIRCRRGVGPPWPRRRRV